MSIVVSLIVITAVYGLLTLLTAAIVLALVLPIVLAVRIVRRVTVARERPLRHAHAVRS